MSENKDLNKELNAMIPNELKLKFKALIAKFNPVPQTPPATPAPQVPQPQALQETKLQDGTVLKYDSAQLAQGSVVTVVTPEGELNAPEGEHTLADGTKIKVVSKDGKSVVESITPAQAPPMGPGMMSEQIVTQMRSEFEQKLKAQEEEKESFKTQLSKVETDHKELNQKFGELVAFLDEVLSLPSDSPVEKPKNKTEKSAKFINRKAI